MPDRQDPEENKIPTTIIKPGAEVGATADNPQVESKDAIPVPDDSPKEDVPKPDDEPGIEEVIFEEDEPAADTPDEPDKPVTPEKPHRSWFRPEVIFIPPLRRKLGSKARPLAIILILIVLFGGGGFGAWKLISKPAMARPVVASKFKLTVVAFKLVSTVPANNATNVNTASDITLNFNQPVTPNKLINNMFLTPKVAGTYVQGKTADQVIFKPGVPFGQGTKVSVMINGTYQSNRGSKLGAPYAYNFTTSIPDNEIIFQDQNGYFDEVSSLPSGQKETYNLEVGDTIGSGASVTLYKGDVNDMLSSLVYANQTVAGYTSPSFSDLSVSTSGLSEVSKTNNVTNNQSYAVSEPDGLYVAVATDSSGKEVGFVWVDFSNFGVLLRQDDQKTVLDAQLFSNSEDIAADTSFYNLNGSVNLLSQRTVNGLTTVNTPFSPSLDMAVATYNNETAVVPVNILDSGGDIRVDQDLSTAQQVYGVTDKPTYKAGDTIKYSGYVRDDNDAQYTNPGSGTVKLYISGDGGYTKLATFNSSIDSNGMFNGTITAQSSWLTAGDDFDQFELYAASVGGNPANDVPVASFTITAQSNASSNITVQFSQSQYLPSNQIQATIMGTDSNGNPLANQTVSVHIYSQDYYENDPGADLSEYGAAGTELPNSPVSIKLGANGQATYTVAASSLPNDGNSQMVSVQASLPNASGVGAAGGDSAIVHQGDGTLTFGTGRSSIPSGDDLVARMYANHLNGNPMQSAALKYQLIGESNSAALATGSVTTDANGYATIDIPASQLGTSGDELTVSTQDENGNTIQAANYYWVEASGNDASDTSSAGLDYLDVSGSSGMVKVGGSINLNVNAPANIEALVTMDRGRIYDPQMVSFNKGNNSYSFTVTPAMAPSFTLTFGYFMDGVYHSEGVDFTVDESSQTLNVKLTPSGQSVSAGQPTTITVNTTDNNGNTVASDLIVDVVSSNAYDLSSQAAPSIFSTLFDPRPIMTSSSSSLSPVGSGGGRCGGGSAGLPSFADAIGMTLYWQPELATNTSGQATFSFTPPAGSWTVNVYAMSGSTQVGSQSYSFTAH